MAYVHEHPRPHVSVIIPVFNKLELTRACLDSLHAHGQEASFEILVADNGSQDGTAAYLQAEQDRGRLRAVICPKNLGFAGGCNTGAAEARGRYLLFLNNDMEVGPDWLDPLVGTLDHDPAVGVVGAKLLFPDGTIQHGGVALVDFQDGEHLLGGNHLSYRAPGDDPCAGRPQQMQIVTGACLLVRRELFEGLGGFDPEYWNGNEDVDLCLKAVEAGWKVVYRPESRIVHFESQSGPERWLKVQPNIRRLQEIWRGRARPDFIKNLDQSFTPTRDNRIGPYAAPRLRLDAEPQPAAPVPAVSVVVLVWNALPYVRRCAESLLRHSGPDCELIFVDNGSRQDTLDYLDQVAEMAGRAGAGPQVRVIANGANLGYPAGNNVGMAEARGRYVCLLNSDTVVTAGWLPRLIAAIEADPRAGLAGPVTNSVTGGQKLPQVGYDQESLAGLEEFAADHAARQQGRRVQALWVVGFCVLIKREVLEKIGGLDEAFGRGNYEDTDYCLRAFLAGYKAVVAWDAFVHHFGSRSFVAGGVDYAGELDEKFEVFRRKWNLSPDSRRSGELHLDRLIAEGFVPGLHFQPLPPGGRVRSLPLPAWEARRWTDQGESFFAAGRLAEAERMFRAVLALRPDHDRAANDLAVVLWQGDPRGPGRQEAVGILAGVLARDPLNEDAQWNLQAMENPAPATQTAAEPVPAAAPVVDPANASEPEPAWG